MSIISALKSQKQEDHEFNSGVVAHAFNLSTREAEAGGFLSLRPVKPCLEGKKKKNHKINKANKVHRVFSLNINEN
jgi:hypothetical protein